MYRTFRWTRASNDRNELTRAYEPLQPHLLRSLAGRLDCDVFIDVGANIGAYSLLMTKVESIREIHAFEPAPGAFAELVANIELNGLGEKIEAHQKAVSDARKSVRFGIVNRLSGANSIVTTSIHSAFETEVEVEAAKLDDCLPLNGKRLCIKIDVEGHERQALGGMSSILSNNSVLLQIEDYADDPDKLPALLQKFGMRSLCRIGPDRYFSNVADIGDRDILSAFEQASARLIGSTLADLRARQEGVQPVRIGIGPWFEFVLKGRAGSSARSIRNAFRRRANS